jgi:putative transposase
LAAYFVFNNNERPHQSLGQKTPDIVYRTAIGGGALIVDKFPRTVADKTPVSLRSAGDSSPTKSPTKTTIKTARLFSAASEPQCAASIRSIFVLI